MHLWAFSALLLKFEYEIAIAVFECYNTHPIVSWGWGLCLWIALSSLVMNIHNPFMRCVTSQYVFRTAWRHNAAACGHNDNNIAAASSATPSPSPVSLNGVFHQDFSTQQRKLRIWKICKAKYIKLPGKRAISIPCIRNVCVIKARAHGCVRNDRETHSTGVTGFYSRRRRSCNPVTQSRAFQSHFAHTHALSL